MFKVFISGVMYHHFIKSSLSLAFKREIIQEKCWGNNTHGKYLENKHYLFALISVSLHILYYAYECFQKFQKRLKTLFIFWICCSSPDVRKYLSASIYSANSRSLNGTTFCKIRKHLVKVVAHFKFIFYAHFVLQQNFQSAKFD